MRLPTERVANPLTIAEYETSPPVGMGERDLRLLGTLPAGRLDVRPTGDPGMFTLRSSSWVGSVVLPSLTIRIVPKVKNLANVLMMFGAAPDLIDWRADRAGYAEADLFEGVAELVLRSVDAATRRGLVHGYRDTQERLPVIRGRLDVQQLAARPWDVWPTPCRYDDFTPDVAENRVLLAAVKQLGRMTTSAASRRSAGELVQRLATVRDAALPLIEFERVRLTPVNQHYEAALSLCRVVLEGAGLTHAVGGHQAATFLVDMNKLYERWIGSELTQRLWPQLVVSEQHPTALSLSPRVSMAPDLIFRRGDDVVLVADVKYKLTDRGLGRTDDYYQLLAYTTALQLPRGMLIYCQADQKPERVITVVGGGQRLYSRAVDISGSWSSVSAALDALAASLRSHADLTCHEASA